MIIGGLRGSSFPGRTFWLDADVAAPSRSLPRPPPYIISTIGRSLRVGSALFGGGREVSGLEGANAGVALKCPDGVWTLEVNAPG